MVVHCPKINPIFRDITCNEEENVILHEIFRVVSRFPCYISCYFAENQFPFGQCTLYNIIQHCTYNSTTFTIIMLDFMFTILPFFGWKYFLYLSYLLQTLNIFLVTVRFFIELVAVPTLYNCFIVEIQVNAAQSKNNKSEIYLGK